MVRTRFAKSGFAALALLLASGAAPAQTSPLTDGIAGVYLAARAAAMDGDHRAAADLFADAIAADPGNVFLLNNAVFANVSLGRWAEAAAAAAMLPPDASGDELAQLATLVSLLQQGDLDGARAAIEAGNGAGPLIDELALGWLAFGDGDMRVASDIFEEIATDPALAEIAYTQLAYLRAAVGDFEGAEAILSGDAFGRVRATERVVRVRAEILTQLGRRDEAVELLDFYTTSVPDPSLLTQRARLAATDTPAPYDVMTTAREGIADVFFVIAEALGGDGGNTTLPLIYARAAYGVDPGHTEAALFTGQLLEDSEQYELAAEAFASIPETDDQYVEAQLGRADALFAGVTEEAGITVLQDLAQQRPALATVHAALGDLLRRADRCLEAIEAYSDALDRMDTTQSRAWVIFYTRAVCYESTDNWPPAEADFRAALELNPEQPNVLNYLGYSLVEQRRNFDEALDMIERAVAARPDNGYITDSLGWVLYRLGRFEEAVAPMERAVELTPYDPIINDHLGDVYWMVGRYREAEFQWNRALSFDPEEADADRIRQKLDVGLYTVLEQEGGVGASE